MITFVRELYSAVIKYNNPVNKLGYIKLGGIIYIVLKTHNGTNSLQRGINEMASETDERLAETNISVK